MVFKPTAMGGKIMYLQKNSSLDLKVTANKHHKIFFTSKGSFRSWKKIVKDDDDDERGNLCWSPFPCSSPLDLASLALASLALALLALSPLAFALLHSALPRSPL